MSKLNRVISVVVVALLGACSPEPKAINRVQTNLVDKTIFDGEWWYSSTSIDVDFDEAFVFNSANAGVRHSSDGHRKWASSSAGRYTRPRDRSSPRSRRMFVSWNAIPAASAGASASSGVAPSRNPHTRTHANPTADATR